MDNLNSNKSDSNKQEKSAFSYLAKVFSPKSMGKSTVSKSRKERQIIIIVITTIIFILVAILMGFLIYYAQKELAKDATIITKEMTNSVLIKIKNIFSSSIN